MRIIGIRGNTNAGKDTVATYLTEKYGYRREGITDPIKDFASEVFGFTKSQLYGPSKTRNEHDYRYQDSGSLSALRTFSSLEKNFMSLSKLGVDRSWRRAIENFIDFAPDFVEDRLRLRISLPFDVDKAVFYEMYRKHLNSLTQVFVDMAIKHQQISPRIVLQMIGSNWGRQLVDEDLWIDDYVNLLFSYEYETGSQKQNQLIVTPDVRFFNEIKAIKDVGGHVINLTRQATDGVAHMVGVPYHMSESQVFEEDLYSATIENDLDHAALYKKIDEVLASLEW